MLTKSFTTRLLARLLLGLSLLLSGNLYAQNSPEDALRASINSLTTTFSMHREELQADSKKLYAMAQSLVDAHWDFPKMSRLVLGKNWKRASEQQQAAFTKEFKKLLIRTYAVMMFKYTGKEDIVFTNTRYKGKRNNRAIVSAQGDLGDGSAPLNLTFSVYKDRADAWRIYNINVAGVSLVITYRTSYNQIIAAKGLDFLIELLESKVRD